MNDLCRCGCRREADRWGMGFTLSCYQRWSRSGRPEVFGPPRWTWGLGVRAGRLEDYAELRREHGLSIAQAALRLGVCRRTADRYEAELRSRGLSPDQRPARGAA